MMKEAVLISFKQQPQPFPAGTQENIDKPSKSQAPCLESNPVSPEYEATSITLNRDIKLSY
jgi:hypothetical protein